MSTRYKHRQIDGEESEMSSVLEMAIDQHWYLCFNLLVMTETRRFVARYSCHPAKLKQAKLSLVPLRVETTDIYKSYPCALDG